MLMLKRDFEKYWVRILAGALVILRVFVDFLGPSKQKLRQYLH
jgi:hypothetical protein